MLYLYNIACYAHNIFETDGMSLVELFLSIMGQETVMTRYLTHVTNPPSGMQAAMMKKDGT